MANPVPLGGILPLHVVLLSQQHADDPLLAAGPDFIQAFVAWFRGDPEMMAAFPGGILTSRGVAAGAYPYLKARWRRMEAAPSLDDASHEVMLAAYARGHEGADDDVMDAMNVLVAALADVRRPRIRFLEGGKWWAEAGRTHDTIEGPEWVGEGKEGQNTFRAMVNYEFLATTFVG